MGEKLNELARKAGRATAYAQHYYKKSQEMYAKAQALQKKIKKKSGGKKRKTKKKAVLKKNTKTKTKRR